LSRLEPFLRSAELGQRNVGKNGAARWPALTIHADDTGGSGECLLGAVVAVAIGVLMKGAPH
jgi:hypothetical protein